MGIRKQPKSFPGYKIHKPSNRAYLWAEGKRHYLGTAGSPESYEAYNRFIAHFAQNQARDTLNLNRSGDVQAIHRTRTNRCSWFM